MVCTIQIQYLNIDCSEWRRRAVVTVCIALQMIDNIVMERVQKPLILGIGKVIPFCTVAIGASVDHVVHTVATMTRQRFEMIARQDSPHLRFRHAAIAAGEVI